MPSLAFSLPSAQSPPKSFLFFPPALPQFIFHYPPLLPRQWLHFKERLLIPFALFLFFSILLLEVGGLPEKIGPLLTKADRQPHDPGAKGDLST